MTASAIARIAEELIVRPERETLSIVVPKVGELPIVSRASLEIVGPDEVCVMMVTMGYCGRDKSTVTGQKTAVPGRIGHEGAGIVIQKGDHVDHVEIGQNVIIFPFIGTHNIGYDWPDGGKGIFSTLAVIPKEAAHPLDKGDITIREWVSLSLVEPFSGALRGLKRADIEEKGFVVILGAGPIGCAQAILAKHLHPAIKVILVDRSERKIETVRSRKVPADHFILSGNTEELRRVINSLAGENGRPLIIHSNPYKDSLKQAIASSPHEGTVLLFSGIYDWNEDDDREIGEGVAIDPRAIHYEEYPIENPVIVRLENKSVTLIGSRGYSREEFNESADLIARGRIAPLPLVTKVLPFDENVLRYLVIEGEKDSNLKIVMSPYDSIVSQGVGLEL
jgi:L-iditol 2-dehydrogenase